MKNHQNRMECMILVFVIALLQLATNFAYSTASGIDGAGVDRKDANEKQSGWNPKDDHPCTVERVSMRDFLRKYGKQGGLPPLYPRPLVITKGAIGTDLQNGRNFNFRNLTREDSILDSFPANFSVTLSSSNSFSEHRRIIPFAQYLGEVRNGPALAADVKSNETWYLFGETYSPEWKSLLDHYDLPPCQACNALDDSLVALSFGIGNSGSGVQWHVHGPGFSEAIHGRKHWVLYPFDQKPIFHPDQTSLNWMHYNYLAFEEAKDLPLECTLQAGDLIYL